ncbi:MAG: hypothetical protein V2A79_11625 [Planctomycetota bacterium]
MRKPVSVLLGVTVALALGVGGSVLACPPGGDGVGPGAGPCNPANCKGPCDAAKCKGPCDPATCKGPCDPGKCKGFCDPAKCKGRCDIENCPGHGVEGWLHAGMMGGLDFGALTEDQRALFLERHPEADTNGDSTLSETELEAFRTQWLAERRATILQRHPEADLDGDGALSDGEFEPFQTRWMEARRALILERHPEADRNGDGTLNEEEVRAFFSSRPGRFGCRGEHEGVDGDWIGGSKTKGHCRGNKPQDGV